MIGVDPDGSIVLKALTEVMRPGSRGGKYYINDRGRVTYGEKHNRPLGDAWEHHQRADALDEAADRFDAVRRGSGGHLRERASKHRHEASRILRSLPALPHVSFEDLENNTPAAYEAIGKASEYLLEEQVHRNHQLGLSWQTVKHAAVHVAEHLREKLNIAGTARELMELGRKHGPVFLAYAIAIEAFEDIVVPAFLAAIGKPYLIPAALAFHSEPVMYPLYFAVARFFKNNHPPAMQVAKAAAIGGMLLLPTGRIAKAQQFGLFAPRHEVKAPGSRGGRFHRTAGGHLRYGEAPTHDIDGQKLTGDEREGFSAEMDAADRAAAAGSGSDEEKDYLAGKHRTPEMMDIRRHLAKNFGPHTKHWRIKAVDDNGIHVEHNRRLDRPLHPMEPRESRHLNWVDLGMPHKIRG
ncbi:MAG TPA: hypothetical protein VMT89_02045 [Candidatus Acidoferrales bacterium]|nr:hypothetical protein [Candidatus Acidoferrales bacterium]